MMFTSIINQMSEQIDGRNSLLLLILLIILIFIGDLLLVTFWLWKISSKK